MFSFFRLALPRTLPLWACCSFGMCSMAAQAQVLPQVTTVPSKAAPPRLVLPTKKAAARLVLPSAAHSKNTALITVAGVDESEVQGTLANGTEVDADVKHGSVFLVKGRIVAAGEFPAGGQAWLRTRTRASDGALSVVLLADAPSEAANDLYRKQVLVGHIIGIDDKTLVVQPNTGPNATPVSLHLTGRTIFRYGGKDSEIGSFAADGTVAVQTRSLPSGLLMAAVVSDSAADLAKAKAETKVSSLSGSAAAVDLDKQQIKIIPKTKPGQVVALAENTRIKVRKMAGTLADIKPGMHVSARLSTMKDSEGHPVAESLSAYDAPVSLAKKKGLVLKAVPGAGKMVPSAGKLVPGGVKKP